MPPTGVGEGVGDELDEDTDFEDVQIIEIYSYISYIRRPENDIVDNNSKPS